MGKERIECGEAPAIAVSCQGDLVIKGWQETAIGVSGDYTLDDSEKVFVFTSEGDLQLHIPPASALHIQEVGGDLVVKYEGGDVAIDRVKGDAVLRGLASGKVGTIHGDASIRHLTGPLSSETIHGDVAISHVRELSMGEVFGDISGRYVSGGVAIDKASGDIDLRRVDGNVTVMSGLRDANLSAIDGVVNLPDIKGDIRLKGGLPTGNHMLAAQRDIVVRWPADLPVNLLATAPTVSNRASLDEFEQKGEAWVGRIGEGKTNLELTAGRQIVLKDAEAIDPRWEEFDGSAEGFEFDYDFEGLGARITSQVNEKIEQLTREIEQQFGSDFGKQISEKMARKAERAAERAEKAAERARQRTERQTRWREPAAPTPPPAPSQPSKKPASPEEQLKILKMVESGVISPEEASMLLEALEA